MAFADSTPPADIVPPQLRKAAPYFLLALAVFAAYGNVYDNAFIGDDKVLIADNAFLRDWSHLGAIFTTTVTAGVNLAGGFYRPLQIVIYLLMYRAAGASSFAFHLLNLALHATNACLLYRLGLRLRFDFRGAFFAALIWALHPVQTEAVTYMSGTADPLYVFFVLSALLVLLPGYTLRRCLWATLLFILALLSKEDALTFPLLAMSCLFLMENKRYRPETYFRTWPLWLVAVFYALMHRYFLSFGNFPFYPPGFPYTSSILCRIYTCLATLPLYLGFLIWPAHLHFDRVFFPVLNPWNFPVAEGFALIALASAQIVLGRSRSALPLSWGLLWFAAAHLLHTGILVPLNSMILEHWLYLPSAGLFLGIGESLICFGRRRQWPRGAAMAVAVVVAFIGGVLTYDQNMIWHDEEGFYLTIFRDGESSMEAHDNLGAVYAERGDYGKAIEQYRVVIDLSHDLNVMAEYNLAVALLLQGNDGIGVVPEAIAHMRRALELDPSFYPANERLAILYGWIGNSAQAAFYRDRAKSIRETILHTGS